MSQADPFPHEPSFEIGPGEQLEAGRVIELLAPLIDARRRALIDEVIAHRTYAVVPVCEDLYDMGNVAAVIRSAEGLGYQELHTIQLQNQAKRSARITRGAHKWLDVHLWRERAGCIQALRARGFRLIATDLSPEAVPLAEIDFTEAPTAIVFGNEHDGVSEQMLQASQLRCMLPMRGFTESFNISVAAALCLEHIARDRIARRGQHGDLTEAQREILRADFYMRSVSRAPEVLRGLAARAR